MTRVSIIIPTHNRASMLGRAIESATRSGTDVEVIVVDDASTDETPSVCRDRAGIVYVRLDRNVGQAQARNVGIAKSTGDFLAFLDDDDLRVAGSIDKQAALLASDGNMGFVYGQVHIGDSKDCIPTGEIRPKYCPTGDLFWELLKGNFIYIASVLVRKQHFEALGFFDLNIRGTEDWDAWLRLAETHRVGAIAEPMAVYRDFSRASGQTSSDRPKMCKSSAYTLIKALRSPRAQEAAPAARAKVLSDYMNFLFETLIVEGQDALSKRHFGYAVLNYVSAIRLNPSRARQPWMIKKIVLDFFRAGRKDTR
jgi:glycosyltransferase involved in cell wall biosynthesis